MPPLVFVKIAPRYVNDLKLSISFPSVLLIGWLVLVLNIITFGFSSIDLEAGGVGIFADII